MSEKSRPRGRPPKKKEKQVNNSESQRTEDQKEHDKQQTSNQNILPIPSDGVDEINDNKQKLVENIEKEVPQNIQIKNQVIDEENEFVFQVNKKEQLAQQQQVGQQLQFAQQQDQNQQIQMQIETVPNEPIQQEVNQQQKQANDPIEQENAELNFKIKKKKKENLEEGIQKELDKKNEKIEENKNQVRVIREKLNINKTFQEILYQSQKDSNYLMMLRNVLSSGSKTLFDKEQQLKKRWLQLRNSNSSQEEYRQKERELKKAEVFEIQEIKDMILEKMSSANMKGFESKEVIIQKFKKHFIEKMTEEEKQSYDFNIIQFFLDKQDLVALKSDQMTLLDKLMKENNLISQEFLNNDFMREMKNLSHFGSNNQLDDNQGVIIDKQEQSSDHEKLLQKENTIKKICLSKYFEETAGKDQIELEDGESRSLFNKIFENYERYTHVEPSDYCILKKRIKNLLLDIKSDELFTDSKFQKEQYEKYTNMLKKINDANEFDLEKADPKVLQELVEISAYIMNNVHYFQKFKLNCDLLHPLDLLYVLEKFKN